LIILSAIWGSAFFAIKISVNDINPLSVASVRLIIGAIILLFYFNYKKLKFKFSFKEIKFIFLIALIGNLVPFSLISWAEIYIKSNTAGLLLSIGPLFALIFSHFMTKDDKFTILKLISISIGLVGVVFIFGIDSLNLESKNFIPKIAIIVAALGYVLSSILAYNLKKIDSVSITTIVTLFAALLSIPFLIFSELQFQSNFSLSSVVALIYLGIFPTAVAFLIRFYIIAKAGPIFLSYVAYLIPVFAILWGYLFLHETVSSISFIGVLLVLIGVFIGQKKSNV